MKIGPTGGVIIGILITIGLLYLYFNYGKTAVTPTPAVIPPGPPPTPPVERIIITPIPQYYTTRYSIRDGKYYRVYVLGNRAVRFKEITKEEYIQGIGGLAVFCAQNPSDVACNLQNQV